MVQTAQCQTCIFKTLSCNKLTTVKYAQQLVWSSTHAPWNVHCAAIRKNCNASTHESQIWPL